MVRRVFRRTLHEGRLIGNVLTHHITLRQRFVRIVEYGLAVLCNLRLPSYLSPVLGARLAFLHHANFRLISEAPMVKFPKNANILIPQLVGRVGTISGQ